MLAMMISACSSSPKVASDVPSSEGVVPDYVVRERYPDSAPDWAKDYSKWKIENAGKGQNYFMGESGFVSERTSGCELADLQAKRKIAQQIATLITSNIGATKEGQLVITPSNSDDPGLKKHFEDVVAAKSMALLSGVKVYGNYWESRDYSKTGGKREVYLCNVMVSIDDIDLKNALRRTSQKTEAAIEDPEAKAVVKEALKEVDNNFEKYISKLSN